MSLAYISHSEKNKLFPGRSVKIINENRELRSLKKGGFEPLFLFCLLRKNPQKYYCEQL